MPGRSPPFSESTCDGSLAIWRKPRSKEYVVHHLAIQLLTDFRQLILEVVFPPFEYTVPGADTNQILNRLDEAKRQFAAPRARAVERLLSRLSGHKIKDALSLIRYHELLLFVRAYPHNAAVLRLAEKELKSFGSRVELLRQLGIDLSPFEHPEVSGIANTSVADTFSYNIVRWLAQKFPGQIVFDWEWFEDENRLAQIWPRFLPLL
jgi:hypothetical protein